MKLSKICEEIEYTLLQGSLETEVRDVIYDSRKIAPETMFVCMVGAVTDGHKYIPDAIDKGASVIVLEREEEAAQIPENITVLKVAFSPPGPSPVSCTSGTCADVRCIV